jgi:hypothetical protein
MSSLQTILKSRGITPRDAIQDLLQRNAAAMAVGGLPCVSFPGFPEVAPAANITLASLVCDGCTTNTTSALLYAYRVAVRAADLPAAVRARRPCP